MIAAVAGTHAALWYVFADSRLSDTSRAFIDQAGASANKVLISTISLAEVLSLVEKSACPPPLMTNCATPYDPPLTL